ncbi:MAG: hypothetical protein WC479_03225 [Candidatus Izemoplasmatales bacterium]|nr:hypothetical protein [Candidatus Izemoplasmatales bacterium]MDD3865938.1 hypothetical protein [Candidatus Izemoplasmatales bacterium]
MGLDQEVVLKVKGTSMAPFFKTDVTSVVLVAPNDLKLYDVVLFAGKNGNYILHRIVQIKNDHCVIQGDALPQKELVPLKAIIAKVSKFETYGKTIFTDNPKYLREVKQWIKWRFLRRYLLWINRHFERNKDHE